MTGVNVNKTALDQSAVGIKTQEEFKIDTPKDGRVAFALPLALAAVLGEVAVYVSGAALVGFSAWYLSRPPQEQARFSVWLGKLVFEQPFTWAEKFARAIEHLESSNKIDDGITTDRFMQEVNGDNKGKGAGGAGKNTGNGGKSMPPKKPTPPKKRLPAVKRESTATERPTGAKPPSAKSGTEGNPIKFEGEQGEHGYGFSSIPRDGKVYDTKGDLSQFVKETATRTTQDSTVYEMEYRVKYEGQEWETRYGVRTEWK